MLNDALSVSPVPAANVKVKVVPASTSVPLSVPTAAFAPPFSAIEVDDNAMSVGASLTFVTVIGNASAYVKLPSLTWTRTE